MDKRHLLRTALTGSASSEPVPPVAKSVVGLARSTLSKQWPLNGLRHPPEGHTNGWYIWAGEDYSEREDFFEPVCWEHLAEIRPDVLEFLALPPGWRFLTGENHRDVWYDEKLLNMESKA